MSQTPTLLEHHITRTFWSALKEMFLCPWGTEWHTGTDLDAILPWEEHQLSLQKCQENDVLQKLQQQKQLQTSSFRTEMFTVALFVLTRATSPTASPSRSGVLRTGRTLRKPGGCGHCHLISPVHRNSDESNFNSLFLTQSPVTNFP